MLPFTPYLIVCVPRKIQKITDSDNSVKWRGPNYDEELDSLVATDIPF